MADSRCEGQSCPSVHDQLLLTVPEAAQVLRVSTAQINRYCKDGQLASIKLGHRTRRILASSVHQLIREALSEEEEEEEEDGIRYLPYPPRGELGREEAKLLALLRRKMFTSTNYHTASVEEVARFLETDTDNVLWLVSDGALEVDRSPAEEIRIFSDSVIFFKRQGRKPDDDVVRLGRGFEEVLDFYRGSYREEGSNAPSQ